MGKAWGMAMVQQSTVCDHQHPSPPSGAGSRGLQTAKGGVGRRRTPALGVEEGLDGIADLRLSMLVQCDAAERQRFGSL